MKLLTSDNKLGENAAHTERMRSRLLSRLKIRLSLSEFFSAMWVPIDYSIGALRLSIGPSTKYKEVEHIVQVIKEEARRKLMSVS